MEGVLTNSNVLGVIFEFLDLTSLRNFACSSKTLWNQVKNYPIWSTLLDEEMKLIVVDRMDAMSLWSLWKRSNMHSTTDYQVCLTGVEIYPVDWDLERRYGSSATLLSLNTFYFLIDEQVVSFVFISLPRNMTHSMVSDTTQGAVVIINTAEEDWQAQLTAVWTELKAVERLQALVLYADERVNAFPLMREVRETAVVMKMEVLTLDVVREFYGTLGKICRENKGRMEKEQGEVEDIARGEGSQEDLGQRNRKRCEIM
jgi:hypothetical protein